MSTPETGATRREFVEAMALMAAAPVAVAAQAAQPKPPPPQPEAAAVAEALAEVVRIRHGKHLDADQRKEIVGALRRSQQSAERLRRFKLTNADEPPVTFHADLP